MAVSHHFRPGITDRQRIKIMTVDTALRRVEGMIKDASMIQIPIWDDVGHAFRWPKEGEIWIVHRDNGIWHLDSRVQQGQVLDNGNDIQPETTPVESLEPGDMKLDADRVVTASGFTVVVVDLTDIQDGWTLKWDATHKRFVASP